jgi:crossover junction endodeoxyribonuclease RuvC
VKVLGIDPGTAACGYGIVQESDGRLRAVVHGWWRTSAKERPAVRLKTIADGVRALLAEYEPDAVAIEESYVGADADIDCTEYPPASVKQAVCGYGRADKEQVQKMVKAILSLDELPQPSHAADALAVAICHALAPPLLRMVAR